jgi:hypothetical protein
VTTATKPPSLGDECQHQVKSPSDPETGKIYCRQCGLDIPTEPVSVGEREIPIVEYMRGLELQYQELEQEERRLQVEYDKRQQPIRDKKDRIIRIIGDLRDVRCAWPGCHDPPKLRSKWCPQHKAEHEREVDRDRQRRHRELLSRLPPMSRIAEPLGCDV